MIFNGGPPLKKFLKNHLPKFFLTNPQGNPLFGVNQRVYTHIRVHTYTGAHTLVHAHTFKETDKHNHARTYTCTPTYIYMHTGVGAATDSAPVALAYRGNSVYMSTFVCMCVCEHVSLSLSLSLYLSLSLSLSLYLSLSLSLSVVCLFASRMISAMLHVHKAFHT